MVPLTENLTYIDVMARWRAPVVLCARTTLGTINHSLLSIEALRARNIPLLGIAFIGDENVESETVIARWGECNVLAGFRISPRLRMKPCVKHSRSIHCGRLSEGRSLMTSKSPVWHPFTQHAVPPEATLISRGEGAWLEAADGRRIFDAISSWWVVTHGHRHPHIVQAIKDQTDKPRSGDFRRIHA